MKYLIVSSAPHSRCGIAKYASQQAEGLRREGHEVAWASVDGGAEGVRHVLDVRSLTDLRRLLALAPRYDRVLIHFAPALFFDLRSHVPKANLHLAALFALPNVEVIAHEIPDDHLDPEVSRPRVVRTARWVWRFAHKLWVHTERERAALIARVPETAARIAVRAHHAEMVKHRECTREEARAELGIPAHSRVLLCIGFIQHTKGFDRAIRALEAVRNPDARLYVVGSARTDEHAAHVEELRVAAARDPRVQLVESFVDDAAFDTWLIAADTVVLPYRAIFSSGVAARAHLFDRQVIAADVGGLAAQVRPTDVVVRSDLELETAFRRFADSPKRVAPEGALKIAFVTPWFALDLPGGAEAAARNTIFRLAEAGVEVEVLTTCITDYFADWSVNGRPEGEERVRGVTVRRFPIQPRDKAAFERVNHKAVFGEPLSAEELATFEGEMIKCGALAGYIAQHRAEYDFFVFIPYMFATTIWGGRAAGNKGVHIPCLHDEGYTRLPPYREIFGKAGGFFFNTPAEEELARERFGIPAEKCVTVGLGVDAHWRGDGEAFRRRHQLGEYLAFVGRKDENKQFSRLLEYFRRFRAQHAPDLKLVLMGPGKYEPVPADEGAVVDLGFVGEFEKRDALAGSLALCQPSVLESFSFVMMEAWLAGRPVVVNAESPVTAGHCRRSNGGLYFRSYPEFAACLETLREQPTLADALGSNGRRYVLDNFAWEVVVAKYVDSLLRWKERQGRSAAA